MSGDTPPELLDGFVDALRTLAKDAPSREVAQAYLWVVGSYGEDVARLRAEVAILTLAGDAAREVAVHHVDDARAEVARLLVRARAAESLERAQAIIAAWVRSGEPGKNIEEASGVWIGFDLAAIHGLTGERDALERGLGNDWIGALSSDETDEEFIALATALDGTPGGEQ